MSTIKDKEFKSQTPPVWCRGCGNYGVLTAIYKALAALEVQKEDTVIVSGIGCSSRLPGYVDTYGFNAVHGRALPIATGVKLANPELTVLAVGGDGDALSIGGGHIPHAARRNVDITYIIMDNSIYGMTKGQASPTTPLDRVTSSTAYGAIEEPLDAVALALAYGITFVARGFSGDVTHLSNLIVEGVRHPGFSLIHVISPCVTWGEKGKSANVRERALYLGDEHDPTERSQAISISLQKDRIPLGIIYREIKSTFQDRLEKQRREAKRQGVPSFEDLVNLFTPLGQPHDN